MIPKKYLTLQRQRPSQGGSKALQEAAASIISNNDQSSLSMPRENHNYSGQGHNNCNRYHRSPKQSQLIGWDSVKCRPIYFQQLQNDYDSNNSFDNEESYDCDYEDNNTDNERMVDGYHSSNEQDGEDPGKMWKEILQQMNQKKRKLNSGSYSKFGSKSSKSRRGLSAMPLSVLERIVSPSRNYTHQHEQYGKKKLQKRKLSTLSSTSSKIKTIGRLNKKAKHSPSTKRSNKLPKIKIRKADRQHYDAAENGFISKNQSHQKHMKTNSKLLASVSDFSCNSAPSPFSFSQTSNNIGEISSFVSLTTPIDNKRSKAICSSSDSNISKIQVPSSSSRGIDNDTSKKHVTFLSTSPSSPSLPQCELQFPDDLDDIDDSHGQEKVSLFDNNNKHKATCVTENFDNHRIQAKSLLSPRPRYKKNKLTGHAKGKSTREKENKRLSKKNEHEGNENIESISPRQISSNTPLSVAKAFFERLDKYELRQAAVDPHSSTTTDTERNSSSSLSLMTPTFNPRPRSMCFALDSVSNTLVASNISSSKRTEVTTLKQGILSTSPTESQFPPFFDEDEEDKNKSNDCAKNKLQRTKVKKVAKKKGHSSLSRGVSYFLEQNNPQGAKKQKVRKEVTNMVKDKKQKNNLAIRSDGGLRNKRNDDNNIVIGEINQISSTTSLSAAKAFFERLDKYELKIAQ